MPRRIRTRPLEQAVMEVPGIRRVRSTTFRGATEISAQFEPSTDMIVALQQVQGKIDDARPALPDGTDLIVERLTPAAFPMYILNLSGPLSSADLYDYAFYVMRPRLARVAGAGQVAVSASDTREIEVVTDPARLLAAGLTVHDVAEKLKAANELAPVGRYSSGGVQQLGDVEVGVDCGLHGLQRCAGSDQGAEHHVAARAGAGVEPGESASVGHARTCAARARRATRAANTPAPKPLSMLQTVTPGAQELSIASRAARPPYDVP